MRDSGSLPLTPSLCMYVCTCVCARLPAWYIILLTIVILGSHQTYTDLHCWVVKMYTTLNTSHQTPTHLDSLPPLGCVCVCVSLFILTSHGIQSEAGFQTRNISRTIQKRSHNNSSNFLVNNNNIYVYIFLKKRGNASISNVDGRNPEYGGADRGVGGGVSVVECSQSNPLLATPACTGEKWRATKDSQ